MSDNSSNLPSAQFVLTRWLFLRCLGIVYFIAFASLATQILGLVGSQGISPVQDLLQTISLEMGDAARFAFPTIYWINCSDVVIQGLVFVGIFFSIMLVLGICTFPSLIFLWFLYLSITTVGGDFLSFQWDMLLLEAGFLAIFFSPICLLEKPWALAKNAAPCLVPYGIVIWLLRILVFRLMVSSGAVKLLSNDPTWRNLTALDVHYLTQPLPTPIAWYAAQLPMWFQHFSVIVMFVIELLVPWLIFVGRKPRIGAAIGICFFQILIAITGNYTFFNLLTVILCISLLDDAVLENFWPEKLVKALREKSVIEIHKSATRLRAICFAGLIGLTGLGEMLIMLLGPNTPPPFLWLESITMPFHIVNSYGLFAVMTTTREEIVVEGSIDGINWREYEFKYKPGDVYRMPPLVEPFQPRLDWQMWFAALSDCRSNPWFLNFVGRLLENDPVVIRLLDNNPFPGSAPVYVRALLYDYHFTDFSSRAKTGAWWTRSFKRLYLPAVSLDPKMLKKIEKLQKK
jgi:uncharacterized membrane protein YphA (DoxX/SURF4 family)